MKMNELPMVPASAAPEVYQQLGQITRQLHDTLRQLGVMPRLQRSARGLPAVRSRLGYIASKSGDSADRVLNAVEQAKQEHLALHAASRRMAQRCGADPARRLPGADVLAFAAAVEAAVTRNDQRLTDIMLAQDFHDLTGQAVAKVVSLVVDLEDSLLQLLVQAAAAEAPPPAAGADRVHSQGEVDELLASLGF